jgi:hypothetical protein
LPEHVVRGKLRQHGFAIRLSLTFKCHERLKADAPVRTHFAEFDFSFVEKPNQGWAGNIQHVSGFLRCQFGVDRHYGNGVAAAQLIENPDEHADGRRR